MSIDQLRAGFPDENAWRLFFESIIWQHGRICPHCQCQESYHISGASALRMCAQQAPIYRQFVALINL